MNSTLNTYFRNLHSFAFSKASLQVFQSENRERTSAKISKLRTFQRSKAPDKVAAVLVPLCIYDNSPCILFVKRPLTLNSHPGEVGFPGGKCDHNDENIIATALRETQEEIGLAPETVDVWSVLPPIDNTFRLYPVLGFIGRISPESFESMSSKHTSSSQGHLLKPNPAEVSYILLRSLDWLANPVNLNLTEFRISPQYSIPGTMSDRPMVVRTKPSRFVLPNFGALTEGPRIWGLTASITYMIIRCLLPEQSLVHNEVTNRLSTMFS